jgi:drug/metabolite transporter (DMT)-like permease
MTSSTVAARPHGFHWPWQASFVLLAATWGCSFWWIKLGLDVLAPVQVAFVRLAIGATALLLVCAITGTRLPRRLGTWRHLVVLGFIWNAVPFTLFALGETHVSSVLAGLINGAVPLTTLAVILLAYREERPTAEMIAGLALGFAGLLVVVGVWQGLGGGEWLGVAAIVVAVICYGLAIPYTRRYLTGLPEGGLALTTGQIVCAALMLLPLGLAGGAPHGSISLEPVLGMLGLGALGSGIAFVMNFQVIREAGPSTASTATYLIPLFAIVVGVAFLGEHVSWNEPVGGLIVLIGVACSQGRAHGLAARIGQKLGRCPELAPD